MVMEPTEIFDVDQALVEHLGDLAQRAVLVETLQEELEVKMQRPALLALYGSDEAIAPATTATHGCGIAAKAVLACIH